MNRQTMLGVLLGASVIVAALGLRAASTPGQEQWGTLAEVERNEVELNRLQPPERVMDAIGVKPGMVVGEVGAGAGRWAVLLAARVGAAGKVFANDIDPAGLALIAERCRKYNIRNIQTVRGTVEDTGLPKATLDLVLMVYTYHHLERPVALLRGLLPTLKPGGSVVVITGDPDKGVWRSLPRQDALARQFAEAGFDLVRTETFLPRDYLLILKPMTSSAAALSGARTIFDAARKGDVEALRAILDGTPDQIHAVEENGRSPLQEALMAGRSEAARRRRLCSSRAARPPTRATR